MIFLWVSPKSKNKIRKTEQNRPVIRTLHWYPLCHKYFCFFISHLLHTTFFQVIWQQVATCSLNKNTNIRKQHLFLINRNGTSRGQKTTTFHSSFKNRYVFHFCKLRLKHFAHYQPCTCTLHLSLHSYVNYFICLNVWFQSLMLYFSIKCLLCSINNTLVSLCTLCVL